MNKISLYVILLTVISGVFVPLRPSWVPMMCAVQDMRKTAIEAQLSLLCLPEHSKKRARTIIDSKNSWFLPYGLYAKRLLGYDFSPPDNQDCKHWLQYVECSPESDLWPEQAIKTVSEFLNQLNLPSVGIDIPINMLYRNDNESRCSMMASLLRRSDALNGECLGTVHMGKKQIELLAGGSDQVNEDFLTQSSVLAGIIHELGHIGCGHSLQQPAYIKRGFSFISKMSSMIRLDDEPREKIIFALCLGSAVFPMGLMGHSLLKGKSCAASIGMISALALCAASITLPSISQYEEWEADAFTAEIAPQENLKSYSVFFEQTIPFDSFFGSFFSTHPSNAQRAAFFAKAAEKMAVKNSGTNELI